jgi:Arc/MetJ family transcription regulator
LNRRKAPRKECAQAARGREHCVICLLEERAMESSQSVEAELVERAIKAGGHKSKKEAVLAALREYVRRRDRMRIFKLRGKIDYDPAYDYKAARRSKR